MTPENQTYLLWGLTIASAVLGWFARQLWSATQRLKDDLAKLSVKLATDYVRYDRLQDAFKPISEQLREIKESLQHKADKP